MELRGDQCCGILLAVQPATRWSGLGLFLAPALLGRVLAWAHVFEHNAAHKKHDESLSATRQPKNDDGQGALAPVIGPGPRGFLL
jgi:hypothetical protein